MAIQATNPSLYLVETDEFFVSLQCPLTLQYMKDPVIDLHGHTFERSEIMRLAQEPSNNNSQQKQFKCPLVGQTEEWINVDELYPNRMVQDITLELRNGLESRITTIIQKEFAVLEGKYSQYITTLQQTCTDLTYKLNRSLQKQIALEEQLATSKQENRQKDEEIESGHNEVENREKEIKKKEKEVKEKENKIEEKESIILVQQSQIEEQKTEKTVYQLAVLGLVGALFLSIFKK